MRDRRTRRLLLLLAVGSFMVVGVYVSTWLTLSGHVALRADFVNAYMGGELLRQGHGSALFDMGLQSRTYHALVAPNDYPLLAFYDTPSAAAVVAPLTVLPVLDAWRVFSVLQLGCVTASVVIVVRAAPWPARTPALVRPAVVGAGVAAYATQVVLLQGQWSGFFALGIALGYRELRRGHEAWAAFWLLAPVLAVKPNLGLGLLCFVLGWGGRRMVAGLVVAVAVVLGVSVAVGGGPGILAAFVHADLDSRTAWPMATMDGLTGITAHLVGDSTTADLLGIALSAALAAVALPLGRLARRGRDLEPVLLGAVLLTLLASPHLYQHDVAMLTPVAAGVLAWAWGRDAAATGRSRWFAAALVGWLAVNLALVLQTGQRAQPLGELVPWALLLATAGVAVALRGSASPMPAAREDHTRPRVSLAL